MKKMIFGVTGTFLFAMMAVGSSTEADTFSYSGAVVDYTVPNTGTYEITAAGRRAAAASATLTVALAL